MNNTEKIISGKKVCFLSLGCKVNAYETLQFRHAFERAGAVITDFDEGNADVVVINTCSVTNIADRKSRQMLHKARKLSPDAVIVAAGCYVQAVGDKVITDGDADAAAGNDMKDKVLELAVQALYKKQNEERACDTVYGEDGNVRKSNERNGSSGDGSSENGSSESEPSEDRTRAFIKIQDGCNQFCTYCIIPYVRGRVRSRSEEDVLGEIISLRDKGYKEIVLTGIHLSSYGVDNYERASAGGFDGGPLLSLIEKAAEIEGIERIRLGSLEPRIITEAFITALARIPKVCPHFHISLQSGSDSVLKRMNRHYDTEEYYNVCELLRRTYELPSINTDIIVGFPGETEEEFEETLAYARKIGFAKIHVFKYSRRKGTIADKMPGQIGEQVKNERSARLIGADRQNHGEYIGHFIGKTVRILTEQEGMHNGESYMMGLTERYVQVGIRQPAGLPSNTFADCLITGIHDDGFLIGEVSGSRD